MTDFDLCFVSDDWMAVQVRGLWKVCPSVLLAAAGDVVLLRCFALFGCPLLLVAFETTHGQSEKRRKFVTRTVKHQVLACFRARG